jgi:hypothetical protein
VAQIAPDQGGKGCGGACNFQHEPQALHWPFREDPGMAHKQVLFRSAAREKILRGATQLTDAVL